MHYVDMDGFQRIFYPARIFILKSLLNDKSRFKKFTQDLNMSDGNVWSHIRALEELGLIDYKKEIDESGREAYTIYSITEKGRSAIIVLQNRLLKLLQQ